MRLRSLFVLRLCLSCRSCCIVLARLLRISAACGCTGLSVSGGSSPTQTTLKTAGFDTMMAEDALVPRHDNMIDQGALTV